MRITFALVFILLTPALVFPVPSSVLYQIQARAINGENVSLSKYTGKVLMVVNTASQCGFTPQYKDLQDLYDEYHSRGFEILAFPSNDFADEPGTDEEIKKFCVIRFGVTFPLFSRAPVRGSEAQPAFRFLTQDGGPDLSGEVEFNFEKFVVDRNGHVKARFGSFVNPKSSRIRNTLEALLKNPA